ncbi:MAG: hypothetical protein J7K26_03870 [Candidatus Aenigmarchaeota archaeon]|nr:hypothetical protein [Candidatus Aenigmarchaeota archaeon]
MKKIFFPLLLSIVVISGCISIPGIGKASIGEQGIFNIQNPDISIDIKPSTTEVKSGRQISLKFHLTSNQNDLFNILLNVYDQCIFTGDNLYSIDSLKHGRSKSWIWRWKAGSTEFPMNCKIKYRVSYISNFTLFHDIISMKESEYYSRQERGTLNEIKLLSNSTTNPLDIKIRFSEQQPFIEGEEYNMYIDYSYSGNGYIEKLENVTIKIPDFINDIKCSGYDYDKETHTLKLNRDLNFYNKKGPQTTCTFTTQLSDPLEIQKITLTANYIYKFDNSLLINVKP